jgi:acyl-CoA synthetase (AMP-forming)/AMP-acid ligase II
MTTLEIEQNIGTVVEKAAKCYGDKIAFIVDHENQSYSFREINEKVNQYANALQKEGIKKGDHVGVMLPNSSVFPFVWLALAKLGCIMVPINTRYKAFDLRYILNDSETTALVIFDEFAPVFKELPENEHGVRKLFIIGNDCPEQGIPLEALASKQAAEFPSAELDANAIMNIQYTSGTTGFPKGAITTHEYWLVMGRFAGQLLEENDYFLSLSPFYYMDPQWELLACLSTGSTFVLTSKISLENFASCIKKYPITWTWGGDEFLYLEQFEEDKDHSLKCMLVAAVTPELHTVLEERFHVKAREVYGMTEIGLGTFVPFEDEHMVGSGTMGYPPAFRQLKIVDEQGNEVPQGQTGELIVKGQGIFKGYYNKPEENAKAFFGEYFRTGDLAYVDKNGYYYFVGRKKDMIRRMGDNISALEVEFALEGHPKIAEAAVIGVPDPIRDEEVKAYIIPAPGETPETIPPEEIIAYCQEKIAKFKIPRYIEYRQEFSRTPSGKIEKHVLIAEKEDLTAGCYDRFRDHKPNEESTAIKR